MDQPIEIIEQLTRWRELAEQATPVCQLCTLPKKTDTGPIAWTSALVARSGRVIGRSMRFEDAQFHAEARQAVLALSGRVETLQRYARYVEEVVELAGMLISSDVHQSLLPLTYDEWLAREGEDHAAES